jgi:hypothetical protein
LFLQQLEALEKMIVPLQNGILGALKIVAKMEEGADKMAALAALAEFRKSDEHARKQLFFLQIWKKPWTGNGCQICQKEERRISGQRSSKSLGGQGKTGIQT